MSYPRDPAGDCICKVCGKEFHVTPSLIRLRNAGQHCSRACRSVTQSRERKGAGTPNWWKGDEASVQAGRQRARKRFDLGPCQRCGAPGVDRHHSNDNTLDNRPENIEVVCRRCHMEIDGRMAGFHAARRHKLSNDQAVAIWLACQEPYYRGMYNRLAEKYAVGETTIRGIRDGRLYGPVIQAALRDEAV